MREQIVISAGGAPFGKWKTLEIGAGAEQAARSLSLQIAEPDGDWVFQPGVEVTVMAGGALLFKGFVDDYAPQFDATSHEAAVTARSKSKDAIDSSAHHPTGEFRNQNVKQIAGALDRFGIGFSSDVQLDSVPVHRLSPGATVFQELEMLARTHNVLLIGRADGSVHITRAGKGGRHAGALLEGVNIQRASATLSERGRHSSVLVRGQRAQGVSKNELRIEHEAKDSGVGRFRPLIIVHEGDTDSGRAQKRAEWQIKREAGWATQASITVYGWRDEAGELWNPEKLVYVSSPRLKIEQDMAIRQVRFSAAVDGGTTAQMTLADPRALGGDDPKGKSGGAWKAPNPAPPPAAPAPVEPVRSLFGNS